jgi:hypothetical protein
MNALILSNALDTNGQNARYVKAAEKWGSDDRVLDVLAIGKTDPAGVVGRYKAAADKHGTLRIRSASRARYEYLQFPMDLFWDKRSEAVIRQLGEEADVIHLNNSEIAYRHFRFRKPALLHHHGSLFRSNPKRMLDMAKRLRFVQAVSTIDLQRPAPDVLHWLPSAYDVDEMHAFGEAHRREPDGRIRIVHCPTNRALKSTVLLEDAVRALKDDRVELVIVEQRPWLEALAIKATADIVFDQLLYGYGCNSIEAWCMGIPVISGADDWTLNRMAKEWPAVPFEEANEATLVDVLRKMVRSADLREDAAQRGTAHVRKYHDELPALARLAELYSDAIRTYSRPRIESKLAKAVTFRSTTSRSRSLSYNGVLVQFHDGLAEVTDPFVIGRLRTLAQRKNYGIEEVA